MKIAVSSTGKSLDSHVEEIFGRTSYFLFFLIQNGEIKNMEVVENSNLNQMSGVGIAVAKMIVEKDVKAVITGNVGPRALDVLNQFGIKVFKGKGLVKDNLQKFIKGELDKL